MVLGKLPVLGRPTNLDYSRARAYWKESHSVIHKVLKFLIIYCLSRKQKILFFSYSTLRVRSHMRNLMKAHC